MNPMTSKIAAAVNDNSSAMVAENLPVIAGPTSRVTKIPTPRAMLTIAKAARSRCKVSRNTRHPGRDEHVALMRGPHFAKPADQRVQILGIGPLLVNQTIGPNLVVEGLLQVSL